jgi:hypothetical protein
VPAVAASGGHGASKSALPDFGTQNVSKSATADFDERAPAPLMIQVNRKFAPVMCLIKIEGEVRIA